MPRYFRVGETGEFAFIVPRREGGERSDDDPKRRIPAPKRTQRTPDAASLQLARTEQKGPDRRGEVHFLWIAFNAAYGAESTGIDEHHPSENQQIKNFLREVIERDEEREIEAILWETYSGPTRVLLENQYLFKLFWRWVRDPSRTYNWRKGFESNRDRIRNALEERNVRVVFSEIFRRLYELRNQVFHGGVAYAEGWGRNQLRGGVRIMADVVPVILDIMKSEVDVNPSSQVWGKVAYPRIHDKEHPEP